MTAARGDISLRPSLLDRLTTSATRRDAFSMAELRNSVQRDLENLLNTRSNVSEPAKQFSQLEDSLLNYGMPDYTGLSSGVEGARDRLRHELRKAIERSEPRLRNVRVQVVGSAEPLDRRLRFRIDAELSSEPIVFQSVLDQTTARYEVRKAAR